jgi:hypothetical protein
VVWSGRKAEFEVPHGTEAAEAEIRCLRFGMNMEGTANDETRSGSVMMNNSERQKQQLGFVKQT